MVDRFHAKSATVYKDEIDISGISNGLVIVCENAVVPVTAFSDTDETYVEGKPAFTVDYSGLYSKASPNFDLEIFQDLTKVDRALGIYPEGVVVAGNLGWEGKTNPSRAPYISRTSQAIMLDVVFRGSDPIVATEVIYVNTALTATVTTAARQVGALTATQKMVCVLRVLGVSGSSPTLDAVLESDTSGFPSATTKHTFSQLTGVGFEIAEVAGAVTDDYWRLVITIGGSTPSFNVLVTIGIADSE